MEQPKKLIKPWAENGLKNSIPRSREGAGVTSASATYEDGFPETTMKPINEGGKAPSGKDMNGILHELSAHIVHQNKGNLYQFDTEFCKEIDGYAKGAILVDDELSKIFISLVDGNKTNFNTEDYSGKWDFLCTTTSLSMPDGFKHIGACESVEQLRTIEPTADQQRILVKSYYAGKNLGGGVFYADFGDNETADNSGTVIVTEGGKRWKRVFLELTPFDFGARLDEDSTTYFRSATGFSLNLVNQTFVTGYLPANIKNGSLKLLSNTVVASTSNTLNFENVTLLSNTPPVTKTFSGATLVINSANSLATLTLPVGGFGQGRPVLITTNNFVATALTEDASSYAHILAKGLWLVQSSSDLETVLVRRIKAKREAVLNVSSAISGSAKQLSAHITLIQNTKILGSNITIDNVEFNNKQITFENVTAKLQGIHSQEGLILINSKVNGELHTINSNVAGIAIYNSVARIGSSSVVSPATNGIIATQASNVMCEYASVFDAGNSGIYAHTASTIEARYASSCFNGKAGSAGSVGTGFESESGSTLFCERSCAIANDSYGFYVNATSQMASAYCFSLGNYHNFYVLSASMFARHSLSINPRLRGYYAYLNSDINALDTNASGANDYDYCAQGGSIITVVGYKNQASKFSTPLNLNGANKIINSNVFELNNYQTFTRGASLDIEDNAITVTSDLHIIATGGTVSTINGRATDGAVLQLRNLSSRNPVTLTNAGNIMLKSGEAKLSSYVDRILLTYDSAAKKWVELCRNNESPPVVITGVVAHGGTIPLPAGYTQEQCKWFVSSREHNPDSQTWDIYESGSHVHLRTDCFADNNRVVTARMYVYTTASPGARWIDGTANYIIIGTK